MTSLRALACEASVAILLTGGCREPFGSRPCEPDQVCVAGTVRFFSFEDGFWAFRGDDGVTYDPVGALPKEFQQDGLRVYFVARMRPDLYAIHMAGPIIDIISVRRLE